MKEFNTQIPPFGSFLQPVEQTTRPGWRAPFDPEIYNQRYDAAQKALQENKLLNRQRYMESNFNDRAVSSAGAKGAYQIMPITKKDYMTRGKGQDGDLFDYKYNKKIRDHVMRRMPGDLGEFYSKEDPDIVNLAKTYAGYNWGAGSMRKYLKAQDKAGVNIHSLDWLNGLKKLNPETYNYVNFIVLGKDAGKKSYKDYNKTWSKFSKDVFPEDAVVDTDKLFASGGGIHIDPSKKGAFTAAASKHGKSVQAFASQVLAHKENYSPAMVKKANFARNAAKWHANGGFMNRFSTAFDGDTAEMLAVVRKQLLNRN